MLQNRSSISNPFHQTSQTASTYLDFIQNRKGRKGPRTHLLFETIDEKMLRIQDIIWQMADSSIPVLISGEEGSGKSFIAQVIHDCHLESSEKKDKPIYFAQCSQESSFEEELFGKILEMSKFGTLVLEQISKLSLNAQKKLLTLIQESSIQTNKNFPRIIATTSLDLQKFVQLGTFRQDLYYRLYVLHLEIPPLRERLKDFDLLVSFFENGQDDKTSLDAIEKLKERSWPGNIQELKNFLQNHQVKKIKDIHQEKISLKTSSNWIGTLPIGEPLRLVETHFILETLKKNNGNRTHAAKILGISLRTLRNKINEFTAEGFTVFPPTIGRGGL